MLVIYCSVLSSTVNLFYRPPIISHLQCLSHLQLRLFKLSPNKGHLLSLLHSDFYFPKPILCRRKLSTSTLDRQIFRRSLPTNATNSRLVYQKGFARLLLIAWCLSLSTNGRNSCYEFVCIQPHSCLRFCVSLRVRVHFGSFLSNKQIIEICEALIFNKIPVYFTRNTPQNDLLNIIEHKHWM